MWNHRTTCKIASLLSHVDPGSPTNVSLTAETFPWWSLCWPFIRSWIWIFLSFIPWHSFQHLKTVLVFTSQWLCCCYCWCFFLFCFCGKLSFGNFGISIEASQSTVTDSNFHLRNQQKWLFELPTYIRRNCKKRKHSLHYRALTESLCPCGSYPPGFCS